MGLIEAGIMGLTTMAMVVAYVLFIPFVIMYILEEVRGRRTNSRDPQLGAKLITTLFMSIAFQVALIGLTAMVCTIVDERMESDYVRRSALGLLSGGLVAGIYPLLAYRKIADNGHARIARQALGVNALLTGAVAMFATISLFLVMFNEGKLASMVTITLFYIAASRVLLSPLLQPEKAPPPAA